MRRLISALGGMLPDNVRSALVGSPSNPSHLASFLHDVLDQFPGERVICLPCRGVLQGYSMKIDWSRHRSFVYGSWEKEVVTTLAEVVRPGSYTLDVGAHIGFYTLILSKLVGPRGRVLAFEPLPWNFSVLCENLRINHCTQVEATNKGLLDRTCELEASFADDQPLPETASFTSHLGTKQIKASCVSLDDFLHDRGLPVHFIKMDVEGSESLVLKGASATIEADHPAMIIEVHHFDGSPESSLVINQLRQWDYQTRWLMRGELTSHLLAV